MAAPGRMAGLCPAWRDEVMLGAAGGARHGASWLGKAWAAVVDRPGPASQGIARHGAPWLPVHGVAQPDGAGSQARYAVPVQAWPGEAVSARRGIPRRGAAWPGEAGPSWHGLSGPGRASRGWAWRRVAVEARQGPVCAWHGSLGEARRSTARQAGPVLDWNGDAVRSEAGGAWLGPSAPGEAGHGISRPSWPGAARCAGTAWRGGAVVALQGGDGASWPGKAAVA